MKNCDERKRPRARVVVLGLLVFACLAGSIPLGGVGACEAASGARRRDLTPRAQNERTDIRLRSFAPNASGQLTIEPSADGGRARLTALSLPDPRSQSRDARTYVVWANSEGRIIRLGELRRDRAGNGGLSFAHPGFERYTVIVTAETSADAERPLGAPVLSTRAGEAIAVFPAPAAASATPATTAAAPAAPGVNNTPAPATRPARTRPRTRTPAGDFYSEVDDALVSNGGGRVIELEGAEMAPRARGSARAAAQVGRAYVVVRFRDVPLPQAAGVGVYVMWAIVPNGQLIYMGSLPPDDALNRSDIYVRVPGFSSAEFDLFVTAEQSRPASEPSDRRALSTRNAVNTLK